jgi:hypothetical protein
VKKKELKKEMLGKLVIYETMKKKVPLFMRKMVLIL